MAVDLQASRSIQAHLDRLLSFLDEDSRNLNLLADTATAAFDAHQFQLCNELLSRYEAIQPLPPSLVNMRGLSAMSEGRFEAALTDFRALAEHDANPVLYYNFAYASAMCGAFEPAADMAPACLEAVAGDFDVSQQLTPDFPIAGFMLGFLHLTHGHVHRGRMAAAQCATRRRYAARAENRVAESRG